MSLSTTKGVIVEGKAKIIPYTVLMILAYAFCIMLLYFTEDFPVDALRLPRLISISTIILLTMAVIRDWKKWQKTAANIETKSWAMLLICTGYVILLTIIGVVLSTIIFLGIAMLFLSRETEMKGKYIAAVIYAVGFSLLLYGSFRYLLQIRLD